MKRNTEKGFQLGSFYKTPMAMAFEKAINDKLKEEGKNLQDELCKLQMTRKENLR